MRAGTLGAVAPMLFWSRRHRLRRARAARPARLSVAAAPERPAFPDTASLRRGGRTGW